MYVTLLAEIVESSCCLLAFCWLVIGVAEICRGDKFVAIMESFALALSFGFVAVWSTLLGLC